MFTELSLELGLTHTSRHMIDNFTGAQIAFQRTIIGYGGLIGHTFTLNHMEVIGTSTSVAIVSFGGHQTHGSHLFARFLGTRIGYYQGNTRINIASSFL